MRNASIATFKATPRPFPPPLSFLSARRTEPATRLSLVRTLPAQPNKLAATCRADQHSLGVQVARGARLLAVGRVVHVDSKDRQRRHDPRGPRKEVVDKPIHLPLHRQRHARPHRREQDKQPQAPSPLQLFSKPPAFLALLLLVLLLFLARLARRSTRRSR
eukprot:3343996-Rhodomonas_salina.2